MCVTCTTQLSSIGSLLVPFIGISAAILVVKFERKIKDFFSKKGNQKK